MWVRKSPSEFLFAGPGQVAPNKLGAAHLVAEVVTGDKQTDTQTGKNYKSHGVSPVILFSYQLIGVTGICLNNP
jgi:hypothetical protein